MGLPGVQAAARLIRQKPLFDGRSRSRADLLSIGLLDRLLVAVGQPMPHIGRGQHNQRDQDNAGQRAQLARLGRERTIDAAHDFIRLSCRENLFLILFALAFEVYRLGIFVWLNHRQFSFPAWE